MSYIDDVFGPSGYMAGKFANYEMRPQQVALANAVGGAIEKGHHLLAEGPCGTGKAAAYLVPAIYHARHSLDSEGQSTRRVVVCTANIALQEQLVRKDLPALQKVLPWPFTYALLKGRRNYICNDKLETERAADTSFLPVERVKAREGIIRWADGPNCTGDRSDYPIDPGEVWNDFTIEEDCKGSRCGKYQPCFSNQARRLARNVDVIVTNYSLFFVNAMLRRLRVPEERMIIPGRNVVIFDEAHEAPDIARDFFGWQISHASFKKLRGELVKLPGLDADVITGLLEASNRFFVQAEAHARSQNYNVRLRRAGELDSRELVGRLGELAEWLEARLVEGALSDSQEATLARLQRRTLERAAQLKQLVSQETFTSEGDIVYIEASPKYGAKLVSKVVDPSPIINEEVFQRTSTVVATSATLTTDGESMEFFRSEIGAPAEAYEIVVESPFVFSKQAMLVLPNPLEDDAYDIPDPSSPRFPAAVAQVIKDLAETFQGRTMGLFTSWKTLNEVARLLAQTAPGFRLLKQGDAPNQKLIEDFKDAAGSILLGVASFWTGVDIQGKALSAVVIDKMPFPNPKDPLMDALDQRLGKECFTRVALPRAIIALRQGFGRLVRSKEDRGVVAILDPRLIHKGYGKKVLNSLPDATRGWSKKDVQWFLNREEAA